MTARKKKICHWVAISGFFAVTWGGNGELVPVPLLDEQRHADGIHFREHNAGSDLDGDLSDTGSNIDLEVDWTTDFVMEGNPDDCETWQDKMGSSFVVDIFGTRASVLLMKSSSDVDVLDGKAEALLRNLV